MPPPRGAAAYKKKDGTLTLSDDQSSVIWIPQTTPGGPPTVSLAIADITSMPSVDPARHRPPKADCSPDFQQTPVTAPKVILKIAAKTAPDAEPTAYMFHFNSPGDPRAEADAIKDLLSRLLAEYRSNDPSIPRPAAGGVNGKNKGDAGGRGSASGSMAFASAVNAKGDKPTLGQIFDDHELIHGQHAPEIQKHLLAADRNLFRIHMEALSTKPESMSVTTFNAQFWTTRIDQLRAYAIEKYQVTGPFNILSVVKPVTEANHDPNQPDQQRMSMTRDQISMIMQQHPLLNRIYVENVPPLTESEFWERFFLSKLVKKLKGERLAGNEVADKIFDKYDEYENITAYSSKNLAKYVPHIIDLEGNEENQGGYKSGNTKDIEMRPRGWTQVPIIQTLNSLSGKLLSGVVPADNDLVDPNTPEDNVYNQLAIRDLQGTVEEQRVILNIREQSRFFSAQKDSDTAATEIYAKQDPRKVLRGVQGDLAQLSSHGTAGIDLHAAIGIDDDSDSDEESKKRDHVGSRASRRQAQQQVLDSMRQRRAQLYEHVSDSTTPMGLPAGVAERCNLAHATTIEFVNQFWSAFLSGDPDRAAELGFLAEALRKSKERIRAVALEAEKVRQEIIERRTAEIVKIYERTKKKTKFNPNSVGGGKRAVEILMQPVVHSLDKALADYQRALAAEGIQASTET
ncbi:hypothetical protein JX266_008517 [Neoarthrinium moseri]|uniref:uncharacterized protein n=1 Tax=Neoarthrinium moseri TaxID=1658444 RepID=UPI001FDCA782|nr:uncharacterized protein JN550_012537 [Neoarthrinium moseri]KAI1845422.1 hypothetical protein JX266_008517 [Neoarthrinium moseri]KAI1858705.1 hypothetical protein JN550_012537 [Neoarthrinium moseri]